MKSISNWELGLVSSSQEYKLLWDTWHVARESRVYLHSAIFPLRSGSSWGVSLLVVCPPPATCRLLRHEEGIFSNCRRYQTINRRELFGYDCRVLNCWLLIRSTTEILIANNVICWQLIHIASSLSGGIMSSFTSETQLIFNPLKSSWQINSIILKVACWPTEEGGGRWVDQSHCEQSLFLDLLHNDLDCVRPNLPEKIKHKHLAD